jgi:hypothetical protein
LPSPAEALQQPLAAFPSWFLRIDSERCGKVVMINESHTNPRWRDRRLADILRRMRHDGCGRPARQGRAADRDRGSLLAPGAAHRAAGMTAARKATVASICAISMPMLHTDD